MAETAQGHQTLSPVGVIIAVKQAVWTSAQTPCGTLQKATERIELTRFASGYSRCRFSLRMGSLAGSLSLRLVEWHHHARTALIIATIPLVVGVRRNEKLNLHREEFLNGECV